MNIIELAKQAGLPGYPDELTRFAALVLDEATKCCFPFDNRPATDPDRYLPGARAASEATARAIAAQIQALKGQP